MVWLRANRDVDELGGWGVRGGTAAGEKIWTRATDGVFEDVG